MPDVTSLSATQDNHAQLPNTTLTYAFSFGQAYGKRRGFSEIYASWSSKYSNA